MEVEGITGQQLINMFKAALDLLGQKYKEVDALNVFPVPDGDTGINMYSTLTSAVLEVSKSRLKTCASVAEAASRGALMGARGNSGVILSQLLRGLAKGVKEHDLISGKDLAIALEESVSIATKAVMKPVEGTILTVAGAAAKEATVAASQHNSALLVLQAAFQAAKDSLSKTPEMLPALKEAGVVDAGGMGWTIILQGFAVGLQGDHKLINEDLPGQDKDLEEYSIAPGKQVRANLEYPYCTEVLIRLNSKVDDLSGFLQGLGDSLMVVEDADYVKVHLHSAHPGEVLEKCLQYGELINIKISNMNEQSIEAVSKSKGDAKIEAPVKPYGIVTVSSGEGLTQIMKSLGADGVISGGQSMNPSIQEILQAVTNINTPKVILLPNNSNILMTANQAAALAPGKVTVIPARTIPQGLAALLAFCPGADEETVIDTMNQSLTKVKSGELTYAVRDTMINGYEIIKGNIIGILDDEIVEIGLDLLETATGLMDKMITAESEFCSVYYGQEVSQRDADSLLESLQARFPRIEFELHFGGQPLYYYIISVE